MVPILILAAGESSRMRGMDKLTQIAYGQPLLRRVAQQAAQVGDTFVALHHNTKARFAVLDGLAVTPLIVPAAVEGQSATLRDAIAQLPPCDAFMMLLADLPDITADDLRTVLDARISNPGALIWRGATAAGLPGHPVLFDAVLRDQFANLSGDTGAAAVVKPLQARTHLIRFADDRACLDLDTPEDWAAFHASRT